MVGAQEVPRTVHRRAGLLCLGVNWVVLGGRVWRGWHFIFHTADGPGLVFSYSTALLHGQGVNLISEGNAVGEGCLNTPRTPILPFLLFSLFRFSVSHFTRFTLLLFHSLSLSLFSPFSLLCRRSLRSRSHKDDTTRGCVEVLAMNWATTGQRSVVRPLVWGRVYVGYLAAVPWCLQGCQPERGVARTRWLGLKAGCTEHGCPEAENNSTENISGAPVTLKVGGEAEGVFHECLPMGLRMF